MGFHTYRMLLYIGSYWETLLSIYSFPRPLPQVYCSPNALLNYRDSGHIISTLEATTFPQNCILATIDVFSFYLNLLQDKGTFLSAFALWKTGIFSHCPEILCKHSLT